MSSSFWLSANTILEDFNLWVHFFICCTYIVNPRLLRFLLFDFERRKRPYAPVWGSYGLNCSFQVQRVSVRLRGRITPGRIRWQWITLNLIIMIIYSAFCPVEIVFTFYISQLIFYWFDRRKTFYKSSQMFINQCENGLKSRFSAYLHFSCHISA